MDLTADRSKAVALLLLIHCCSLPLFMGVQSSVLVLLFSSLCPSNVAIIFMGKREPNALLKLSSWARNYNTSLKLRKTLAKY